MAKYYEDLVHDITDARDFLNQEGVGYYETLRVRDAIATGEGMLAAQREHITFTPDEIEEVCDGIRNEIGGWCACIHAEVSASNPCTCD